MSDLWRRCTADGKDDIDEEKVTERGAGFINDNSNVIRIRKWFHLVPVNIRMLQIWTVAGIIVILREVGKNELWYVYENVLKIAWYGGGVLHTYHREANVHYI